QELLRDAADLADAERKNARIRREQLEAQVAVLRDQSTQKQQEVDQLTNKIENLKQSLALAQKQLNIINSMEEGVVSQVDKLKAQRDAHDLKSELEVTQLQLPQAKSAEQEAENRVREQELTFRSDAATELSKQRLEQASVIQQLKGSQDKVKRTEV